MRFPLEPAFTTTSSPSAAFFLGALGMRADLDRDLDRDLEALGILDLRFVEADRDREDFGVLERRFDLLLLGVLLLEAVISASESSTFFFGALGVWALLLEERRLDDRL